LALADDLPQLWNHPTASNETRKRILRAVLKEIIVTVAADRLCLVLHWQGGDHTWLEVVKNRTGQNRWKTDVGTVQLVRELARTLPDQSIAPVLNRLGIRSAKGYSWTQLRVRNFRSVHQIAVYREGERAERHELIMRAVQIHIQSGREYRRRLHRLHGRQAAEPFAKRFLAQNQTQRPPHFTSVGLLDD
jgi:hypothetical protein